MTTPQTPGDNTPAAPALRTGRRPTLTRDLAQKIVDVVKVGNYLKTAAAYCGVGYSTLLLWQQKGRAQQERVLAGHDVEPGQELYLEFLELLTQAEAQAQVTAVAAWRTAMRDPSNWRAAMEYLARKAPDQWAASSTVHVADADSEARIAAAVEAATSSLLQIGDGQGAYDPAQAGLDELGLGDEDR